MDEVVSDDKVILMTFPKRRDKVKKWIVQHQDGIFIGTAVVSCGAIIYFAVKAGIRAEQVSAERRALVVNALNAWAEEQKNAGEILYPLDVTKA